MTGLSISLDLSRLRGEQKAPQDSAVERDLIIIGAGPAGLTAGLYAGRALLKPLILVGQSLGGKLQRPVRWKTIRAFPGAWAEWN